MLLLNARGWKNNQIAEYLDWTQRTVRQTIHRWQEQGLAGLWDAPPRLGRQPLWQEADLVYLEESLQQEPRTYNSKQLAEKLWRERQVQLSPDRIRRVLKKRGRFGSEQELATGTSSIQQTKPSSKLTRELLKITQAEGKICLKYLDESGFCLWSPVSYSYPSSVTFRSQ